MDMLSELLHYRPLVKHIEKLKHSPYFELLKEDSAMFAIIYGSYLISFLFHLLLTNWLGTAEYGLVNLFLRFFGVLLPILAFGVDGVFIKHTYSLLEKKDYPRFKGLLNWAISVFLITSLFYLLLVSGLFYFSYFNKNVTISTELMFFFKTAWLPPLLTLLYILSALLRAVRHYYASLLLSSSGMLLICALILWSWHYLYDSVSPLDVFLATGFSVFVSLLFQFILLAKHLPTKQLKVKPLYEHKKWFPLATYVMFSNSLSTLSILISLVMLYFLQGAHASVAYFSVCFVIANVFLILTKSTALFIGPWIGPLLKNREIKQLQTLIKLTSYFKAILGLVFLGLIALLGNVVLSWFGSAYIHLYMPLLILCILYYLSICLGSSPSLMQYSDLPKRLDMFRLLGIVFLIVLNLILIPLYGVIGAIIANGLSMLLFEVLCTFSVKKHLKINLF